MSDRINLEQENGDDVSKRSSLLVGKIPSYKDRPPPTRTSTEPVLAKPEPPQDQEQQEEPEPPPEPKRSTKGLVLSMRVGTRGSEYVRKDKVSTIRFNFVCSKELYERERKFAVTHEYPMTRNKWLEKVITKAIETEENARANRKKKQA